MLAGRGYNMYDRGMNCDIPRKLRQRYGANVDSWISWSPAANRYPRLRLQHVLDFRPPNSGGGAPGVRSPNLHLIYLTNFKCGPDRYIKHFAREAGRRAAAGVAV